jgi:SpoVK/Ycf46/Vps4 family AAA+-type ATPase
VDEIDKAFSGFQSHGDSGTTNRVLSTFLTWLSEKSFPVFVVAIANNID